MKRKTNPKPDVAIQIDDTDLIVVRMHAPGRNPWRESFHGKWVSTEKTDETYRETGLVWRVGVTTRGSVVAYRAVIRNEESRRKFGFTEAKAESLLLMFDSAADFAAKAPDLGYPAGCVEMAVAAIEYAAIVHHDNW